MFMYICMYIQLSIKTRSEHLLVEFPFDGFIRGQASQSNILHMLPILKNVQLCFTKGLALFPGPVHMRCPMQQTLIGLLERAS